MNGYASLNDATTIVERSLALNEPIVAVTFSYRLNGEFNLSPHGLHMLIRGVVAFGFLGGKEVVDAGFSNAGFLDREYSVIDRLIEVMNSVPQNGSPFIGFKKI